MLKKVPPEKWEKIVVGSISVMDYSFMHCILTKYKYLFLYDYMY